MTDEITNLVIEIGEQVGAVVTYDILQSNPKLHRASRIRSIHSSLVIEQNTLTLEQVTDVINGKTVLGPPQGIRQDSRLTAKTLAATLGMTDRQVERILAKLKADGRLVRHGASKNGYWEVV